jgi:hypothetical protein
MNGRDKRSRDHVDVPRLMEVICGYQEERYPFEKYVALMTFSAWLLIPKEADVVRRAELISAASVILAINHEKLPVPPSKKRAVIDQIAEPVFSTLEVADALVNTFTLTQDASTDATFITAFIFRCPEELNPSVNKALDFMKKGGFTEDLNDDGDDTPAKMSPATIKEGWRACAVSSPFACAAPKLNLTTIEELAIDEEDGVLEAGRILKDVSRLRKFFGFARYIQNVLLKRLHETSVKKIAFVEFPDTIEPHMFASRPFSPRQLEIIKSYRAPRISRFDSPIGPH